MNFYLSVKQITENSTYLDLQFQTELLNYFPSLTGQNRWHIRSTCSASACARVPVHMHTTGCALDL